MVTLRLLFIAAAGVLFAQQAFKPPVIVLLGPPASGKTTQAEYLHLKYDIPTISIEELLATQASANKKPLARSDDSVNGILRKRLLELDTSKGFALDGYPATRSQAEYLDKLVRELKLPSPRIVEIRVPDAIVRERSSQRGSPEDKPAIVEQRLADYHRESKMIHEYYAEADIWTIDGTRDVGGVSTTIRLLVEDR
jgi:adenylate kinase